VEHHKEQQNTVAIAKSSLRATTAISASYGTTIVRKRSTIARIVVFAEEVRAWAKTFTIAR
jgi:hypothetical protein